MQHLQLSLTFLIAMGICTGCSPKNTETSVDTTSSAPSLVETHLSEVPTLLSQIENKTINPLCLLSALTDEDSTNVATENCDGDLVKGEDIHNEDGSVGIRFQYPLPERNQPYIRYLPVGKLGTDLIMSANWSTGGTGHNSTLVRLKEIDNKIVIAQHYTGGDRCNGGLMHADIKDGHLLYGVNITRYGLLDIVKSNGRTDWPFGIVDGSAIGCVATAEYADGALQGIRLPKDFANSLIDTRVSELENPEQYCFDSFLLRQTDGYIPADTLAGLIREIEQACFSTP